MNLKQIKDSTLRIINEYSNKGAITPEIKNKDYILRMNDLINDFQMEVCRVRRIVAEPIQVTVISNGSNLNKFDMPNDFMELKEILNNNFEFKSFTWQGKKTLCIPTSYSGVYDVFYFKYPEIVDSATPDTYELEVDIDAQTLAKYYVGGHLMLSEDNTIAYQLLNEYNLKLANLTAGHQRQTQIISNFEW